MKKIEGHWTLTVSRTPFGFVICLMNILKNAGSEGIKHDELVEKIKEHGLVYDSKSEKSWEKLFKRMETEGAIEIIKEEDGKIESASYKLTDSGKDTLENFLITYLFKEVA